MTAPTTQRDEIRQLLAAASEPLTRPEIFAQCKLVADEVTLSTIISQLMKAGAIERAGEREREKGAPLALYSPAAGGGRPSKERRPGQAQGPEDLQAAPGICAQTAQICVGPTQQNHQEGEGAKKYRESIAQYSARPRSGRLSLRDFQRRHARDQRRGWPAHALRARDQRHVQVPGPRPR